MAKPHFEVVVSVKLDNGQHGFRTVVGLGADNLGDAMARSFQYAAFYLREGDGYEMVHVELNEACADCMGTGFSTRTPRKTTKCKTCKGIDPQRPPHIVFNITRQELRD